MTNSKAINTVEEENKNGSSHISSESYPISQPLATILRQVYKVNSSSSSSSTLSSSAVVVGEADVKMNNEIKVSLVRDSVEEALRSIIQNCFVAMDEMYFAT